MLARIMQINCEDVSSGRLVLMHLSLFDGFGAGVQVNIMVKETCDKATQVESRDVRPTTSTPVKRRHPETHLPSPDVSPVQGKDNASDTVYEPGDATLASESTLGEQYVEMFSPKHFTYLGLMKTLFLW